MSSTTRHDSDISTEAHPHTSTSAFRLTRPILGLLLLLPALFVIGTIVLYPTAYSMIVAFTDWNGFTAPEWNQFENFTDMMSDDIFWLSFWNSIKLALISAAVAVLIGYVLAEIIVSTEGWISVVYRTVLFIPVILPLATVGVMFRFLYNPSYGLLNGLLALVGLEGWQQAWLGDADLALYSVIAVNVWKIFGLNMLLFFAGLQAIPHELYEAARIDGVSWWQERLFISIPLLRPVLELALVISLTFSLKTYDLVYVMTSGGPGRATTTIPIWIIENAFRYNAFGYAAAIAVVFFLAGIVLLLAVRRLVGQREEVMGEHG